MRTLGIDPGANGGLALIDADGTLLWAGKMPATERDVWEALRDLRADRAWLERVRSSPQMGRASVFTFGWGYGGLRMALTGLEIPFEEVLPQRWQKALGCLTGGDKNVSKAKAQGLWPSVKVTHSVADAMLIAEYGRRMSV